MAHIAVGNVDCTMCESGKVSLARFLLTMGPKPPATFAENPEGLNDTIVVCPICGGSGKEPVGTKLRGDMFKELAQYVAPKRKAIEHSGPDGGPVPYENMTDEQITEEIARLLGIAKSGSGSNTP